MPLNPEQQKECERIFNSIYSYKVKSRSIAEMFKELPDRATWAEYYRVIPEPRSLHGIREKLGKGKYKSPEDLHSDLELVFANAIHFNEETSVISNDARTLQPYVQGVLSKEWETSVTAGMLPKIEAEAESSNEPQRQQPSRASRTRDIAPPRTVTPQQQSTPQPQPAQQLPVAQPTPVATVIKKPPVPIVPVVVPVPPNVPVPASVEPEEDSAAAGLVRDKKGDELVSQLEASFPGWPGPGLGGWMELPQSIDLWEHCSSILQKLKSFKDTSGDFAFDVFQRMPEETTNKTLSFSDPMSVSVIENKLKAKAYTSSAEFDKDIFRLFEKARKWHEEGTYPYGRVLVLQCVWQALTSSKPEDMQVDVTPSSSIASDSAESITFKGITYHIGDWVHLSNKDVPPKPIVAQIQRIDRSDPAKVLSLTWYSRPEQTLHQPIPSKRLSSPSHVSSSRSIFVVDPVPQCGTLVDRFTFARAATTLAQRHSRVLKIGRAAYLMAYEREDGLGDGGGWEYMPISKFDSNHTVVPRKLPSPFLKGVAGIKKRGHGGPAAPGPQKDRSVITAAGGQTVIPTSMVEVLPDDTVQHFDRDPYTNQLLWFSGAPIETPRIRHPKHSLDYLYFLAQQQEMRHRAFGSQLSGLSSEQSGQQDDVEMSS
ncbi:Bromo adjacent homology domain [Rhizoctonia solani]|uniref:Bromo adjacent homology domain n=1 Tax=Rhizoctonia solani TaxID=456999 RepID=A0A8H7IKW8_9AGAM|nr:Bromo adjacent homology domain [Rhizoctonia solani]